jgi:hypothetical protein
MGRRGGRVEEEEGRERIIPACHLSEEEVGLDMEGLGGQG